MLQHKPQASEAIGQVKLEVHAAFLAPQLSAEPQKVAAVCTSQFAVKLATKFAAKLTRKQTNQSWHFALQQKKFQTAACALDFVFQFCYALSKGSKSLKAASWHWEVFLQHQSMLLRCHQKCTRIKNRKRKAASEIESSLWSVNQSCTDCCW